MIFRKIQWKMFENNERFAVNCSLRWVRGHIFRTSALYLVYFTSLPQRSRFYLPKNFISLI